MEFVPLCVPFARKDEAKRAGARWQGDQRVWACDRALLAGEAYARLRPFVPRIYRPELRPPYIRPWMVPQTIWGKNLRALLPKEQWDIVRRRAYEQAGNRCRVCGGRGPQWPVEADEAWDYDDATHTQTLKGVIALCPDCHHIRHWGKSLVDGREEEVFRHLMAINGWTEGEATCASEEAMVQWEERSRHSWTSDYSWVTRTHGFIPDEAGATRADASNRELVLAARRRAEDAERFLFGTTVEPPRRPVIPQPSPQRRNKAHHSILAKLRTLFR